MIGCDSGDRLFLTTIERKLFRVDGPMMVQRWVRRTGQIVIPSPVLDADSGHLIFTDDDGMIYAVNTETGAINWKTHMMDNCSPPLVTNGHVFLISGGRELHVLAADSGNPIGSHPLKGMFRGPPVAFGNHLCLTSFRGDVVITRPDGMLMGGGTVNEVIYSTPSVDGDRIFLGTERGNLYTLSPVTDSG